jgi:hypothetical protein
MSASRLGRTGKKIIKLPKLLKKLKTFLTIADCHHSTFVSCCLPMDFPLKISLLASTSEQAKTKAIVSFMASLNVE